MKVVLITQARLGSTRLPKKIFKDLGGKSVLELHLERLSKAKKVDTVVLATTVESDDDAVEDFGLRLGYNVYRGSQNDVLDRYYQAAKEHQANVVLRCTSDCPLIDPALVDLHVDTILNKDLDYCSNTLVEKYPDGQDVEAFKFSALERAWKEVKLSSDREHVTQFIRRNSSFCGGDIFTSENIDGKENYNDIRLTIDEQNDLEVIQKLVGDLGFDRNWEEYTKAYIDKNLAAINGKIIRNEGLLKSKENE